MVLNFCRTVYIDLIQYGDDVMIFEILLGFSNRLLIDFHLCVYDRVCKVPRVLFNICVCERKLIFFV
jgi:hypothetical protein